MTETKVFYPDSDQLYEHVFYKNEKVEGIYKLWYKNGVLYLQDSYRDGKLDGKCKIWLENGKCWKYESYQQGKLDGERTFWRSNGDLWKREFYRDGQLVDRFFNRNKKNRFLRLRRSFNKHANLLDSMMISDLEKIARLYT